MTYSESEKAATYDMLLQLEGKRRDAYVDTAKIITIGVGSNIQDSK